VSWLITGGAGYIGSHVAQHFLSNKEDVVVVDSLINSTKTRIDFLESTFGSLRFSFCEMDIRDTVGINALMHEQNFDGVIHLAALKSVKDSFEHEDLYKEVNAIGTSELLDLAITNNIEKFIFSSTAAVYGFTHASNGVSESSQTLPISPYGASKLHAEESITEKLNQRKVKGTSLRFFNVIGTSHRELIDTSKDNLFPALLKCLRNNTQPKIFGSDYATQDGTAVRDYVDVRDIAKAHFLAAIGTEELPPIINIGTGQGYSVRQVISAISELTGTNLIPIVLGRREGDPAEMFADISLAREVLKFEPEYNLLRSLQTLLSESR
jgi:UDP-glucose 4-epimerase